MLSLLQSRVETVNGELIIQKVQQADSGMYQCIAENKYGAIYSSAELKILGVYLQFICCRNISETTVCSHVQVWFVNVSIENSGKASLPSLVCLLWKWGSVHGWIMLYEK